MSQSMGNEILKKMYPKFLDLYENIGIATATTSEIIIEENGFAVPIDGTIYPFNEEFVRSENTEEMPSYDPEDTGEVILQFNPYIVNTLSKTITSKGFSYSGRTLGIGYKITLDPKRGQTQIYFEEDDLHLELYPRIVTKILH